MVSNIKMGETTNLKVDLFSGSYSVVLGTAIFKILESYLALAHYFVLPTMSLPTIFYTGRAVAQHRIFHEW